MIEIEHCVSKSILAPICICFGGFIFLTCTNTIIGAIAFALILLLLHSLKLNCFTDKCGFLVDTQDMRRLVLVLCLNISVAFTFGLIIRLLSSSVANSADGILIARMNTDIFLYIIKSVIAGFLMMYAVYTESKQTSNHILFLACAFIVVFTGCMHCIIEAFYYGASTLFYDNLGVLLLKLFIAVFFNFIGCNLYNLFVHKSFIHKGSI